MKGIDKHKKTPKVTPQTKPSTNTKEGFSPNDMAKMIIEGIKQTTGCIESVFSYISEREKTRRVEAESLARIVESNNRLEEVREQEATKRLEICLKSIKEINALDTQKDKINLLKVCIHQAITTMNEIKLIYNETGDRSLIDMIHEQNLKLIEISKTINALP